MAPGARNRFSTPMFEPKVFWELIYCIEGSTCNTVGAFRRHGHCAPLVTTWLPAVVSKLFLQKRIANRSVIVGLTNTCERECIFVQISLTAANTKRKDYFYEV